MRKIGADLNAARERIQRVLYMSTGIGALVFGGLLAGKVVKQWHELVPAYALAAVTISILIPGSLIALAWLLPQRFLNRLAGATVIGFVLIEILWLPAMTDQFLENADAPWYFGVTAVHATLGAIVWRSRWAWIYPLAQGPLVAVVRYLSVGEDARRAVLDGVGAMIFCGILVGTCLALLGAAQQQDITAARARAHASIEAAKRTREREQARINAIVHDDIMSVLLVAGREEPGTRLAEQAEGALASIATLSVDPEEAPDYEPAEVATSFRSAVTDTASHVEFWMSNVGTKPIPADVVEAMSEALVEAVRNSVRHGGPPEDLIHRVVSVSIADNAIRVRIQDTGRGFNIKAVSAGRLGVRVSILERMHLLSGGHAEIDSKPGRGTTVTLTWVRNS